MTPMFDFLAQVPHAVEASDGGVVGEITRTFHVTWPWFISQCVSFLIGALLLMKVAVRPLRQLLGRPFAARGA